MHLPTRAGGGRSREVRSALVAAAAFLTCFAASDVFAAPQQLAQRMSPAQDMTRSSGTGEAQRVAPMSGTSRAGLADQMGRSGGLRPAAAAAGSRPMTTGYTPPSRRESRQSITPASSSRPGRSQDVNAISDYNRSEGALLVGPNSNIREISQLRGATICFPNPADQGEAANFLGGRSISYTALTADGPPTYLVEALNRGQCQAIYMSRQTQQMMANISLPGAIVLTR